MQWVNCITQPAFGMSLLHWWATPTQKLFWFIQAVGELPVGAQFPGPAGWVSFEGHLQLRSSHSPGKWISLVQAFSFPKILMLSLWIEAREKDFWHTVFSSIFSWLYQNQNYSDLWYYYTSLPGGWEVPLDVWKSTKPKLFSTGLDIIDPRQPDKHQNNWLLTLLCLPFPLLPVAHVDLLELPYLTEFPYLTELPFLMLWLSSWQQLLPSAVS